MNKTRVLVLVVIAAIVAVILFTVYIMPWIGVVVSPVMATVLAPFAAPPASTVFIFVLSLGLSGTTQLLNRKLVDLDRRNRLMAEITKFQELQRKAQKTGDKNLLLKVERRKKYMQKIQGDMTKMQFRPTLYFMVPFIIIFQLLAGFYGNNIVAILPFDLRYFVPDFLLSGFGEGILLPPEAVPIAPFGEVFGLRFFAWYMLSGFGFATLMTRLSGMQPPEMNLSG